MIGNASPLCFTAAAFTGATGHVRALQTANYLYYNIGKSMSQRNGIGSCAANYSRPLPSALISPERYKYCSHRTHNNTETPPELTALKDQNAQVFLPLHSCTGCKSLALPAQSGAEQFHQSFL